MADTASVAILRQRKEELKRLKDIQQDIIDNERTRSDSLISQAQAEKARLTGEIQNINDTIALLAP